MWRRRLKSGSKLHALHTLRAALGPADSCQRMECVQLAAALVAQPRGIGTMNWLLLKNSLLVSTLTTLLAASFGLLAALWLAGLPSRFRNAVLALAVIALALPPFLVTN